MNIEKRLEAVEKRLAALERAGGREPANGLSVLKMDLVLPEADIDGLHFNETKVHAVYEKHKDGWYYSRDILFLSARNIADDNSRDILTEYLESDVVKEAFCACLDTDTESYFSRIRISLTQKPQGVKRYNGVACPYWLEYQHSSSPGYFCRVHTSGETTYNAATSAYGCAPAFCVGKEVTP